MAACSFLETGMSMAVAATSTRARVVAKIVCMVLSVEVLL